MPFVGARYPESLNITLQTTAGINLSGVTSAEVSVSNPRGAALTWDWTVASPSASSVRINHTFSANGNDATVAGSYTVSGWLVTASTRYRIRPLIIPFERYP